MHELAVTESILELANQAASENGASRVTEIFLTIGQLSSIVADSVQFYWDHISKGTPSEGAILHFERVPARLHCKDCGESYQLSEELLPCPACGRIALEIISGEELQIDHIEIMKEKDDTTG
jgi:hydrogenase nickel incorporation protein HypA/HybF